MYYACVARVNVYNYSKNNMKKNFTFVFALLASSALCAMDYSAKRTAVVQALDSWVGRTANDHETLMRAHYMAQKALFFINQFDTESSERLDFTAVKNLLDTISFFGNGDTLLNKSVFEWAQQQTKIFACSHTKQIYTALCNHKLLQSTLK